MLFSFSFFCCCALYDFGLNWCQIFHSFWPHPRPTTIWWSFEVEEAVGKRRKTFSFAHRSDEERQAYISASLYVTCLLLSLLNVILNQYIPSFAQLLMLLFRSTLPKRRHRLMPTTWDLTFPSLSRSLVV